MQNKTQRNIFMIVLIENRIKFLLKIYFNFDLIKNKEETQNLFIHFKTNTSYSAKLSSSPLNGMYK